MCDLLIHKGDALAGPLHALIRDRLSGSSITLVEGEGIHPSLARHHPVELVRFAFVLEPEQPALFDSRPWATLPDRLLQAWHQPIPNRLPPQPPDPGGTSSPPSPSRHGSA